MCLNLKPREREEDKEMAEFLRLKLMPLEQKLKVAQSESALSEEETRIIVHVHGVIVSLPLFSFYDQILRSPRDKSWRCLPTNRPSQSLEWPSLRIAAEPPSVPSCNNK